MLTHRRSDTVLGACLLALCSVLIGQADMVDDSDDSGFPFNNSELDFTDGYGRFWTYSEKVSAFADGANAGGEVDIVKALGDPNKFAIAHLVLRDRYGLPNVSPESSRLVSEDFGLGYYYGDDGDTIRFYEHDRKTVVKFWDFFLSAPPSVRKKFLDFYSLHQAGRNKRLIDKESKGDEPAQSGASKFTPP